MARRPRRSKLVPVSELRATWLGHASVLFESEGTRVLTDPLLRPGLFGLLRRRGSRPAVDVGEIDAVLISHVHHDHLDLPSLGELGRDLPLLVPAGTGRLLEGRGFRAVREVESGERLELGALQVSVTPAQHGAVRRGTDRPPALGFRIDASAGPSAYFAGDTELFEGMAGIGAPGLDLALLPVWGWGPTLGPGHMDPGQAAEALRLLGAARAVPIHWGTYSPLGAGRLWPWMSHAPAAEFVAHARERAPAAEVVVLGVGETTAVGTGPG